MIYKCLACVFSLWLVLSVSVFAQEDLQSTVDYKVNKMKQELNLTDSQADAIGPVLKGYIVKRQSILDEAAGQGIVDHTGVNGVLKGLKEAEYQKLSKILSADQMKKWIDKEHLMASLNPDSADSTVDDGPSLSPEGANFKF